jgi:methyl-accepting chemotaxis protein
MPARGFAVVAPEVKNLATRQSRPPTGSAARSGNLTGISSDVVGALNVIKIAVSEYVSSTAVAAKEHSTVTNDMSTSMRRAAAEAASIGRAG